MARVAMLQLIGDASQLQKTLKAAEGDADRFGAKFGGLGKTIAGVLAGGAVLKFGVDSVKAATDAAQSQSKLELALKNNTLTVGVHAKDFAKLNTQLAKHTLADDDVIAATEARMATFGMSQDQIKGMIPTVMDLSAKLGIDGPEAADIFDKSSENLQKRLKALGIEGYKPTGDRAKDLARLNQLVAEKTSGAAAAQLAAAGPGATLKKHMDELQESIGGLLVPALTAAANVLSTVIDWFTNLAAPVKIAIGVAAGLAAAVWAITAASTAWTAITEAVATVQAALNTVLALNPIVLVALAVVALSVALYEAYQHVTWFRNIVDSVFGWIGGFVSGAIDTVKNAVTGVFNWVKDYWPLLLGILTGPIGLAALAITRNWDTIKDGFTGVKNWIGDRIGDIVGLFTGMPGRIAGVAAGMFNSIGDAFRAAINMVIDAWDSLHFKLGGWTIGGPFGTSVTLPTVDMTLPYIRPLAGGGIVTGPTLALLGEAGPEMVTPLGRGGTTVNYQITVTAIDPTSASSAVISAIKEYEFRNGSGWRGA